MFIRRVSIGMRSFKFPIIGTVLSLSNQFSQVKGERSQRYGRTTLCPLVVYDFHEYYSISFLSIALDIGDLT